MKTVCSHACAALLVALFAGCYEVPVTGRRAMNLVDDKQVAKMSIAAFEDLKSSNPLSRDRDKIEQLNRVGERLSKVVFWEMPDADWEFVVFDVPQQINAFAMAGGKIGVFSGLYKIVSNDDQLASVLAHEIAHVTAKHVHEKLSREMALGTVGTVGTLGASVVGGIPLLGAMVLDVYGINPNATSPAFDREKEKEADYIGLIYMARAGYDPQEAPKVLEKLEEVSAGQPAPAALLSTHPSNPERIMRLMDEMPRAQKAYQESHVKAVPTLVK